MNSIGANFLISKIIYKKKDKNLLIVSVSGGGPAFGVPCPKHGRPILVTADGGFIPDGLLDANDDVDDADVILLVVIVGLSTVPDVELTSLVADSVGDNGGCESLIFINLIFTNHSILFY